MHLKAARSISTRARCGMAVPIVLIFATILGVLATYVIRSNSQNFRQNLTSYNQLQATFAARAGMEHALLKVKYLHRELFDAACLAQGRNPLFNFALPIDLNTNPGPRFCIHSSDASPNAYGFISPGDLNTSLSAATSQPQKWLETFRSDLHSTGRVTSMDPLPDAIRTRMKEPFTGQYDTTAIEVLTQDISENRTSRTVTNQVVLKVSVGAVVNTARGESFSQAMSRTVRVARDRSL